MRKSFSAKNSLYRPEEVFAPSNAQIQMKGYTDYKESGKHDTTKSTNKAIVTNPREMEIHKLPYKKFQVIILKKLSEMKHTHTDN